MQAGDIIFVRGDDLLDELIEWAEDGVYSHVALYVGDGFVIEATGGNRIKLARLSSYASYDVGSVSMTDQQREDLIAYAMTQQGKRYDWALIGIIALRLLLRIDIPYAERALRICSTFIRDCFDYIRIQLTEIVNCTPQELSESKLINISQLNGRGLSSCLSNLSPS